jgi:hypothetical protein
MFKKPNLVDFLLDYALDPVFTDVLLRLAVLTWRTTREQSYARHLLKYV